MEKHTIHAELDYLAHRSAAVDRYAEWLRENEESAFFTKMVSVELAMFQWKIALHQESNLLGEEEDILTNQLRKIQN